MHAWLDKLDQHFPVRYTAWLLSLIGFLLFQRQFVQSFMRAGLK